MATMTKRNCSRPLFIFTAYALLYCICHGLATDEQTPNEAVIQEQEHETGYWMTIETESTPLHSSQSKYQKIEVYNSPKYYGKVLVLDDCVQLAEKDANSYNEMMAHVPMFAHDAPKKVLVIGELYKTVSMKPKHGWNGLSRFLV